jgi:hypothetical protein
MSQNDPRSPRRQVIRVGVETVKIVSTLPKEFADGSFVWTLNNRKRLDLPSPPIEKSQPIFWFRLFGAG